MMANKCRSAHTHCQPQGTFAVLSIVAMEGIVRVLGSSNERQQWHRGPEQAKVDSHVRSICGAQDPNECKASERASDVIVEDLETEKKNAPRIPLSGRWNAEEDCSGFEMWLYTGRNVITRFRLFTHFRTMREEEWCLPR